MSNEINQFGNSLTAEFWQYDGRLSTRWNPDPKPTVSYSPYSCFKGNPIYYSDPLGDTTFVRALANGTYQVIGGNIKGNNNGIYVKDEKGKIGALIGYSATPESFYNSETQQWMGTINPNDQTGRNFLNNEIIKGSPALEDYMLNASGGQKYDFKRSNAANSKDPLYSSPENFYRGMPILGQKEGKQIYASARDIGNIGAGLVAGRHGLPWFSVRLAFDAKESLQKIDFVKESSSTKYAERLGWRMGSQLAVKERAFIVRNQPGVPELERLQYKGKENMKINTDIMTKDEYQP